MIHHPDRGSRSLAIRYTECLAEAGIAISAGSVGDSHDNALAESVIGLFRTGVIGFFGPWKSVARVEWETLQWVIWYNTGRLHGALGHRPPREMEGAFHAGRNALDRVARVLNRKVSGKPGAVQHRFRDHNHQRRVAAAKRNRIGILATLAGAAVIAVFSLGVWSRMQR